MTTASTTAASFSIHFDQEVSVTVDVHAEFEAVLDGKEIERWNLLSAKRVANTVHFGSGPNETCDRHELSPAIDCEGWLRDWIKYAHRAGRPVFRDHHSVIDSRGNTVDLWDLLDRQWQDDRDNDLADRDEAHDRVRNGDIRDHRVSIEDKVDESRLTAGAV